MASAPAIDVERLLLQLFDHVRVPVRFAEPVAVDVLAVVGVKQSDTEVARTR